MINSRRQFLQAGTGLALATWFAPGGPAGSAALATQPRTVRRRLPPSDRVNIAIIGCGKMANEYHLPALLEQADTQVVAVCEVDEKRRMHALQRVEEYYSTRRNEFVGCQAYTNYRDLLEREDIDAVCIATPDHWHALPLIEACRAGKDVYCEKPLTLTLAESRLVVEAARKYERIVQTGSQQRSNVFGPFCEAVEIIRSGRLGKIQRVTVGVGDPSEYCNLPEEELEPGLDWDLWLGPAPLRGYHSELSPRGVHRHFPAWRKYREYSGGGHTDMGAHHYDIALWALELDQTGPVKIIPPADHQAKVGVRYLFANGIEIEHGGPSGCVFHGSAGQLHIDRGHLTSAPESIVKEPLGADAIMIPRSPGHHRNWLDCLRTRERPVADVEYGARTVSLIQLGNLAYWHRQEIAWNPDEWKFADEDHADWMDYSRREPWLLPQLT